MSSAIASTGTVHHSLVLLAVLLAVCAAPARAGLLSGLTGSSGGSAFDLAAEGVGAEGTSDAAVPPASSDPGTGSRGIDTAPALPPPPPEAPAVPYLQQYGGVPPEMLAPSTSSSLGAYGGILNLVTRVPPTAAPTMPFAPTLQGGSAPSPDSVLGAAGASAESAGVDGGSPVSTPAPGQDSTSSTTVRAQLGGDNGAAAATGCTANIALAALVAAAVLALAL